MMMKRMASRRWLFLLGVAVLLLAVAAFAVAKRYFPNGLRAVTVVAGLDTPWAVAFLPDGRLLVTERPGRIRIATLGGELGAPLRGLPPVYHAGEGGLMDVAIDPDFASNQRIFWTYSEPPAEGGKSPTVVASAILDGDALHDVKVLFRQLPEAGEDSHFGSRLLFSPDGHLFVGLGDRDRRDDAQLVRSTNGKLIRIAPDGSIPADNPFVAAPPANPAIWSLGHRNIQGLAWHPVTGELWASEHGPNGGDEINIIRRGANYGWPVITYGCEYGTCKKIGEGSEKAGMEQPVVWFGPQSVPLTALLFVESERYPDLRGQLLVGTLWGQALMRLRLDGNRVIEREPVRFRPYGRIRDLAIGPDGWIYAVANVPDGRILRLQPLF
jgi:glucose/arabinose dehydrogenase